MRVARISSLALAGWMAVWAWAASAQEGVKPEPKPQSPPSSVPPPVPPRSQLMPRGTVYLFEQAPDFELDGSFGRRVKLSSLRGNRVLLLFAPYKEHLAIYKGYDHILLRNNIRLVGVCGEKQHTLMQLARRDTIDFMMLSDVTGDISTMYGLFDYTSRTVRPGAFLLDQKGVVWLGILGQLPGPREVVSLAITAMPEF